MLTTNVTALTAPTRLVQAGNGVRYAYRRFGNQDSVPLVLMQHFRGSMDNWDTELLDTLAAEREVIAFNNAGVASTNGETPRSVQQMARDAIAFIEALNLEKVDVLGFSLGGFIAQEVALLKPDLVRKLVLAGPAGRAANAPVAQGHRRRSPQAGCRRRGTPLHHVQAHPDQPGQRPRVSGPVHGTRGGP
jgi:pimeloyl-ACP methyl ester carboxylesterase